MAISQAALDHTKGPALPGAFDPLAEMPALIEIIAGLASEFRDVAEASADPDTCVAEARELRAATDRLQLVVRAVTARALVNEGRVLPEASGSH
jgi:hypothetical protein